ncbi:unnamed protein product, partial [Musa textilis]
LGLWRLDGADLATTGPPSSANLLWLTTFCRGLGAVAAGFGSECAGVASSISGQEADVGSGEADHPLGQGRFLHL